MGVNYTASTGFTNSNPMFEEKGASVVLSHFGNCVLNKRNERFSRFSVDLGKNELIK